MGYVTVTGGKEAIKQAGVMTRYYRLKEGGEGIGVGQLTGQFRLLVDRILSESGLYAPEHAALALKQAEGDPYEATFLLRTYRSTLPRHHYTAVLDTEDMRMIRRISSSFRDIPGGQILGPTRDYTHRLLDFTLRRENEDEIAAFIREALADLPAPPFSEQWDPYPKVIERLRQEGIVPLPSAEETDEEPFDMTRQNLPIPAPRSARMQALTRGETGAMVALSYSSMRGFGSVHPTIGELRVGYVRVYIPNPYAGSDTEASVYIGEVLLTEVDAVNSFRKNERSGRTMLDIGYGLCFGHNEQKAIAMSILEYSLEQEGSAPAEDEEFVLMHIDSIESGGYASHLKLPHYVTFHSKLDRLERADQDCFAESGDDGLADDDD